MSCYIDVVGCTNNDDHNGIDRGDCPYCEIDRLTAQLTKTEKVLKDTIRIHLVDDDEWDVEEKTMKIFTRIMKEVE